MCAGIQRVYVCVVPSLVSFENAHRERRTQADTHLHTIAGRTVTRQDEEATESKWDAAFLATGFSHACQYFKSTLCRDIR